MTCSVQVLLAMDLIFFLVSRFSLASVISTSIGDGLSAGVDPQLPISVDAQADALLDASLLFV